MKYSNQENTGVLQETFTPMKQNRFQKEAHPKCGQMVYNKGEG